MRKTTEGKANVTCPSPDVDVHAAAGRQARYLQDPLVSVLDREKHF